MLITVSIMRVVKIGDYAVNEAGERLVDSLAVVETRHTNEVLQS